MIRTKVEDDSMEAMNGIEVRQIDEAPALVRQSELEVQIRLAQQRPRSVKHFLAEVQSLATLTETVAESCFYALPRQGKTIEGPSARLAEIAVTAWGNCQAGARVVDEDGKFITAQGVFRDLEKNTCITYEVKRRITGRDGRRFNDDMIGVTANAACSIALRNAVFKGIPKAFWEPAYLAARETAIGNVKSLTTKRAEMLAYFAKMGVSEAQILSRLQKEGVDDVDLEDLAVMKGLATALKEGDTTLEDVFPPEKEEATKSVKEKLKAKAQKKEEPSGLTDEEREEYGVDGLFDGAKDE